MLFDNKRRTVIFLLCFICALVLISWSDLRFNQQPLSAIVQQWAADLLTPVQREVEKSFIWMRENISAIQELGSLRQENQQLKEANDALTEGALRMQELYEENQRLYLLLEYERSIADRDFDPAVARIVGWPSTWSSLYYLGSGANEGFKRDMAVITPRGVVGKLIQVNSNSSVLMLLQDTQSAIGGRLPNGYIGIVRGQGSQNPTLRMENISIDAEIRPGDVVRTSGLGDLYPEGLPIGTVISSEPDISGLHKTAILQMSVDCYRLYEVMVIRGLINPLADPPPLDIEGIIAGIRHTDLEVYGEAEITP